MKSDKEEKMRATRKETPRKSAAKSVTTPQKKGGNHSLINVAILLLVAFVAGYFVASSRGSQVISEVKLEKPQKSSPETSDQKQKTGVQIERQIRDMILIQDNVEVVSTSYINTKQALETLTSGKNSLLDDAEVGDYYVVFEDRAILYRDSKNQIINYAPIIRQK